MLSSLIIDLAFICTYTQFPHTHGMGKRFWYSVFSDDIALIIYSI